MSVTEVRLGEEVPCELAKLLEDKVLIRCDGIWTELRAPSVDRMRAALRMTAVFLHAPLLESNAAKTARLECLDQVRKALEPD
jgi:hypothetical protein